ncbi:MAG: hypothetical protein ACYSU0_11415 [Planctomycetota bacterium]|jgi:hypothetical protein
MASEVRTEAACRARSGHSHRMQALDAARVAPPSSANGSASPAADALRGATGWKGQLRRRIEALSWDRIAGHSPAKGCLPRSGASAPAASSRGRAR